MDGKLAVFMTEDGAGGGARSLTTYTSNSLLLGDNTTAPAYFLLQIGFLNFHREVLPDHRITEYRRSLERLPAFGTRYPHQWFYQDDQISTSRRISQKLAQEPPYSESLQISNVDDTFKFINQDLSISEAVPTIQAIVPQGFDTLQYFTTPSWTPFSRLVAAPIWWWFHSNFNGNLPGEDDSRILDNAHGNWGTRVNGTGGVRVSETAKQGWALDLPGDTYFHFDKLWPGTRLPVSVSFWLRLAPTTSPKTFLSFASTNYTTGLVNMTNITESFDIVFSSNSMSFVYGTNEPNTAPKIEFSPTSQFDFNEWHHYVFISSGSRAGMESFMKIYIDGELVASRTNTSNSAASGPLNAMRGFNLGRHSLQMRGQMEGFINGQVDDLIIHKTAIDDSYVKALYLFDLFRISEPQIWVFSDSTVKHAPPTQAQLSRVIGNFTTMTSIMNRQAMLV